MEKYDCMWCSEEVVGNRNYIMWHMHELLIIERAAILDQTAKGFPHPAGAIKGRVTGLKKKKEEKKRKTHVENDPGDVEAEGGRGEPGGRNYRRRRSEESGSGRDEGDGEDAEGYQGTKRKAGREGGEDN